MLFSMPIEQFMIHIRLRKIWRDVWGNPLRTRLVIMVLTVSIVSLSHQRLNLFQRQICIAGNHRWIQPIRQHGTRTVQRLIKFAFRKTPGQSFLRSVLQHGLRRMRIV